MTHTAYVANPAAFFFFVAFLTLSGFVLTSLYTGGHRTLHIYA